MVHCTIRRDFKSAVFHFPQLPHKEMALQLRVRGLPEELRVAIASYMLSLDAAAEQGLLPIVRTLLNHSSVQHYATTAIDLAIAKAAKPGYLDVVVYLHQWRAGGRLQLVFEQMATRGYFSNVPLDENQHSPCYRTRAIDASAANGHVRVVQFLLEAGGYCFSIAAIDRAAENGHAAVIDLLLQHENKVIGVREPHGRAFTTLGIRWAERNHHKDIAKRLQLAIVERHR